MVKTLAAYVGKENYFSDGNGDRTFKAKIIMESGEDGTPIYYRLAHNEEKIRIYSKGKNRVVLEDGVFLFAKNRKQRLLSRRLIA